MNCPLCSHAHHGSIRCPHEGCVCELRPEVGNPKASVFRRPGQCPHTLAIDGICQNCGQATPCNACGLPRAKFGRCENPTCILFEQAGVDAPAPPRTPPTCLHMSCDWNGERMVCKVCGESWVPPRCARHGWVGLDDGTSCGACWRESTGLHGVVPVECIHLVDERDCLECAPARDAELIAVCATCKANPCTCPGRIDVRAAILLLRAIARCDHPGGMLNEQYEVAWCGACGALKYMGSDGWELPTHVLAAKALDPGAAFDGASPWADLGDSSAKNVIPIKPRA
jgi:hypothetical protein